ncbi:MAG: hypothetical protein FWB88_09550 [Defluviitaleaceae bacterium]|nr:hypothetical protein [Defluviitaleaceae bacterium]MCL2239702.1 hypothetical protein [Defluviitaleaceae bacterium]
MTKLELMTVMRSLKKLHERGMPDAALEVINEIIAEAEQRPTKPQDNIKED